MKRSPRPEKRSKKERKLFDRILPVMEEPQITAQPADEAVKMHLDTGCSWIRPQFPEDKSW